MRRVLAVGVVLGALLLPARPAAAAASGAGAGSGPSRAELLERIAVLTDEVDDAAASLVGAAAAVDRLSDEVSSVRARVRARAVAAYVHGTGLDSEAELAAPAVYLEVTARKEKALLGQYRAALTAASARQAEVEAARSSMASKSAELASAREQLAELVAREAARQKALQQAADAAAAAAARRQALAAAEAASRAAAGSGRVCRASGPAAPAGSVGTGTPSAGTAGGASTASGQTASGSGGAGGTTSGEASTASGGAAVSCPTGLLPRHIEATRRQSALMGRYPFGVLAPGPLPASLGAAVSTFDGLASWYGGEFNGRPTASGAIYDEDLWTAASRTLPLGSLIVVSRGDVRVLLLVNDRGPYVDGRVLDLSAAAARALDVGVSPIEVTVFGPAHL